MYQWQKLYVKQFLEKMHKKSGICSNAAVVSPLKHHIRKEKLKNV